MLVGRLRRADVAVGGDGHASPSGPARQQGPTQEAASVANAVRLVIGGWVHRVENEEDAKDDGSIHGQVLVLGLQKRAGARFDHFANLVHLVVAAFCLGDLFGDRRRSLFKIVRCVLGDRDVSTAVHVNPNFIVPWRPEPPTERQRIFAGYTDYYYLYPTGCMELTCLSK